MMIRLKTQDSRLKTHKGQSTLEYVIILTAVVTAVIAGAITLGNKANTGGLGKLMDTAGTKITTESKKIVDMF